MSLALNDTFRRSTFNLIACHSPLVLDVTLGNTNPTAQSGDVTATIQGIAPADNTDAYTFDMAYVSSAGSLPTLHTFKLDITDIVKKICNEPAMQDDTSSGYDDENRLVTKIRITIESDSETPVVEDNQYAHGFNQVNTPDSSCLVDFADKDTEAIIPVVAGAPMLWYVWSPSSVGGTFYLRLFDSDGNQISTITLANPVTKGLYQGTGATFNENFYDDWDKVEEYELSITPNTEPNSIARVTCVALKQVCEGDVVLCWLNRFGVYSYMAFERFPTHRGNQKHIGEFDLEVYDIADLQSRKKSRGYSDVHTTIRAVAKSVPTEYFEAIEDLFYSMDVYYFTGTLPEYEHDDAEWLRVTVKGNLVDRKKRDFENVSVEIKLPEKYTQLR